MGFSYGLWYLRERGRLITLAILGVFLCAWLLAPVNASSNELASYLAWLGWYEVATYGDVSTNLSIEMWRSGYYITWFSAILWVLWTATVASIYQVLHKVTEHEGGHVLNDVIGRKEESVDHNKVYHEQVRAAARQEEAMDSVGDIATPANVPPPPSRLMKK